MSAVWVGSLVLAMAAGPAIAAKDAVMLESELTEDFVLTSPGMPDRDRQAFVEAVVGMPYRVLAIEGEDVRFRVVGAVAVLAGIQRAKLEVGAEQVVVAKTAFVDLFVRVQGHWKLQQAFGVELPSTEPPGKLSRN